MVEKKKLYRFGLRLFASHEKREETELISLIREFGVAKNARALEVGVGTGRFISVLKKAFSSVDCFGIDVVPDFVDNKISGVKLSLQSAENLSFEDNFFDAVLCIDVLHHVPDRERALEQIARVVKPGGLVLFRDIRPSNAFDKLFYKIVDVSCLTYNSNLPCYFSPDDWEKTCQKNGILIQKIQKFDSQLDWIVCKKTNAFNQSNA